MTIIGSALPMVDDVPEHFPATVLWDFRLATMGAQLLFYAVVGVGFGLTAKHVLASASLPLRTLTRSIGRIAP